MKNIQSSINQPKNESTYALLVRSEEKPRNAFETLVYATFILCAIFTMWQFAQQSVAFPIEKASLGTVVEAHQSGAQGS